MLFDATNNLFNVKRDLVYAHPDKKEQETIRITITLMYQKNITRKLTYQNVSFQSEF